MTKKLNELIHSQINLSFMDLEESKRTVSENEDDHNKWCRIHTAFSMFSSHLNIKPSEVKLSNFAYYLEKADSELHAFFMDAIS